MSQSPAQVGLHEASAGERLLRNALRVSAALLAAAHAVVAAVQQRMNPDGICYLDMGDAFVRQDWQMAISSVWSPLYGWLLGVVVNTVKPGMRAEFPVVHAVNFAIFLGALASFDYFWRLLTRQRDARLGSGLAAFREAFPQAAWDLLGYGLFFLTALNMNRVSTVTPDLGLVALVFLVCALLLRIRMGRARWPAWLALGLLLGLAYLTKSAMFPLAFVFLACLFLPGTTSVPSARWLWLSITGFVLVAGTWVAAISVSKERLTIGDAGWFTYAKYASDVPFPHWQGDPPEHGSPKHPSRQIFRDPDIYEFARPVGGTYPIAYDPSYWYEGLDIDFHARRQLNVLGLSGYRVFHVLGRESVVVFVVAAMFLLARRGRGRWSSLRELEWCLIVLGLAPIAMYSVVLTEERYIGVFVTILIAGVLSALPAPERGRQVLRVGVIGMVLVTWLNIGAFNARWLLGAVGSGEFNALKPVAQGESSQPASAPWAVAEALEEFGVSPGAAIGHIGYSGGAFWARLARVRIVAEITTSEADRFWNARPERRLEALRAFREAGVRAVVADLTPGALEDGWVPLGRTDKIIYSFEDEPSIETASPESL